MRNGCWNLIPFLLLATISSSSQAQAQSSASSGPVSYPQYIVCEQIENFGVVTDKSIEHPHDIVLNFIMLSDGAYSYGGVTKNWKDGGGGESANAFYDATTGKFLNGTSGIVCPPSLPPS
jgi:hypothetical protein